MPGNPRVSVSEYCVGDAIDHAIEAKMTPLPTEGYDNTPVLSSPEADLSGGVNGSGEQSSVQR